jgi:hypothetical protein
MRISRRNHYVNWKRFEWIFWKHAGDVIDGVRDTIVCGAHSKRLTGYWYPLNSNFYGGKPGLKRMELLFFIIENRIAIVIR